MDDPDDFFAGLEDDEPPPSPFKGFSHLVPYGPVFNSVDREREASILASVHTTQGKILERRASNATPRVVNVPRCLYFRLVVCPRRR